MVGLTMGALKALLLSAALLGAVIAIQSWDYMENIK
jgi:hypothetical protein